MPGSPQPTAETRTRTPPPQAGNTARPQPHGPATARTAPRPASSFRSHASRRPQPSSVAPVAPCRPRRSCAIRHGLCHSRLVPSWTRTNGPLPLSASVMRTARARPSSARWMTRTRPSSRNTIPVTLTEWRGRSSIGARLLRCPLVGQPPLLAGEDVDDRLYRQVILGVGDADNLQHLLGLGEPQESLTWGFVAEREGFEPPGRLHARLLSRQLQSTRLCHRSQPVRRRQDDRSAHGQALLFKYPEPSAARIYSRSRAPRGTSCTTYPCQPTRARRG